MIQEDKYNFITANTADDIQNILKNEEVIVKNNLIVDCDVFEKSEIEEQLPVLEKISLTLAEQEKTFVVVHSSLPTDEWDEFILIPTLHEAKEYIFMEELTRGF